MMWQISDSWKGGHVEWYLYDSHRQVGEVVCLDRDLGTYYAELTHRINFKPRYFTDVGKAKDYLWTLYALEKAS
jgi:hypothetical protein